ncbi:hypothetical protein [Cerasicoccus maritimus]|uniref:hypothetical protein n=1 Tax=Cerasicoccus maritimus TaxID=490089 RepID=UPI002852C3E1|nr:hypothetical protein [Cerasicoccus maritimus]
MSLVEIKEEIKALQAADLDEVAALILQLRRARDPERKDQLAELIDGEDFVRWTPDADQ